MESPEKQEYNYDIPIEDFFQFAISVDSVIFGYDSGKVKVMLIKRGVEPFKGSWALPGDLVYTGESLEDGAKRVVTELTGIENLFMNQLRAFGEVDRHSFGRVVTVGYISLVEIESCNPKAQGWAEDLQWFEIHDIPELAFDHNKIFSESLDYLQENLETHTHIGFELLPKKFTLLEYQQLTEYVLDKQVDKANFRKKLLTKEFIEPLSEVQKNVKHRPAKLYQVNKDKIQDEA